LERIKKLTEVSNYSVKYKIRLEYWRNEIEFHPAIGGSIETMGKDIFELEKDLLVLQK
jgi:hypothetical protein